ncbi:uncharacterized protein knl1 [Brachionichthys hirsutus]|uniref:uncharacterized protein knl1 n=1 Tax=Brachionichthys hirsutus TaxID=412623 RepID=UPI003604DBBC
MEPLDPAKPAVQEGFAEDGIQQMTGMETLFSAPLHASQQREKVNFDIGGDFVEKTVMFSTDDGFMDMTHIANDKEIRSLQNYDTLPNRGAKSMMFTASNTSPSRTANIGRSVSLPRSKDLKVEKSNTNSLVPPVLPDFENFLARLFKPGGPSVNPTTLPAGASAEGSNGSSARINTHEADVDKENQPLTFLSARTERSINPSGKVGGPSSGSAFCPKEDTVMDMTESQTGLIQGFTNDGAPLHSLYPTLDASYRPGNRLSQPAVKATQQRQSHTVSFMYFFLFCSHVYDICVIYRRGSFFQVNFDAKDERREKTILFTAGGEFMDMTLSHTANISSVSGASGTSVKMSSAPSPDGRRRETCGPPVSSGKDLDPTCINVLSGRFRTSGNPERVRGAPPPPAASSQEAVDGSRRGSQRETDLGNEHRSQNAAEAFGELFHGDAICPESDVIMDMTECQTGRIVGLGGSGDPFQLIQDTKRHPEKLERAEAASGEKTRPRPSLGVEPASLKTKLQRKVTAVAGDDCRDKTVTFTAAAACMDMTRTHTVNIIRHDAATDEDTVMDMTESQTGLIQGFTNDGAPLHSLYPTLDASYRPGNRLSQPAVKATQQRQSHTVNLDAKDERREKTILFTAGDEFMDMTECQTGRIVGLGGSDDPFQLIQDTKRLPEKLERAEAASGEKLQRKVTAVAGDDCRDKTVTFTADAACMDITRTHTVNIIRHDAATDEDTVMDMTESQTGLIQGFTNDGAPLHSLYPTLDASYRPGNRLFQPAVKATQQRQSHTVNLDAKDERREKTILFTAGDEFMDMTECQTGRIVGLGGSDDPFQLIQDTKRLPEKLGRAEAASGEKLQRKVTAVAGDDCRDKTVTFTADAACMDMTRTHTVNIIRHDAATDASQRLPNAAPALGPQSLHNVDCLPVCGEKTASEACMDVTQSHAAHRSEALHLQGKRSSSANPGLGISLSGVTELRTDPVFTKATRERDVDAREEAPGSVSAVPEDPDNATTVGLLEDERNASAEAQTGQPLDEPQQSGVALETSVLAGVEIPNHADELDSAEAGKKEAVDVEAAPSPSRKSRRASLAVLHSKIRRLSHMITAAPDPVVAESCTAPLPGPEHAVDRDTDDKSASPPVPEPEPETACGNVEINPEREQPSADDTHAQSLAGGQPAFSSKTVQLMSRLSVGGFKPKLPGRGKADSRKTANSGGESSRAIIGGATKELGDFDTDVSDIFDEELGSCEDISEMLDASPQSPAEKRTPPPECCTDGSSGGNVSDEEPGRKRRRPEDEIHTENEKRSRPSTETTDFEMGSPPRLLQRDQDIPCTASRGTDDSSGGQAASVRCAAAFESTCKQSLFESQLESMLEDYASDVRRKFNDGTVTVSEFFKLFNIDFVILNPRQSVRPNQLLSDTDLTPMDLLRDRHIDRPKRMVYETDVQALAERVEELKLRMRDLNKPLKTVNKALWEDMRNSSETELKSFGAKLKERNNLFRKSSKVQSHELKEALYSKLAQANLDEQKRLRGTVEKADEMLRSLDDCIQGLEAELAAVEEEGSEDAPSLKSLQEEMKTVSETLAEQERQTSELEVQNERNSQRLKQLKAETRNLENHVDALNLVNEWKFGGKVNNCVVYTFLYDTFHLQLLYQESEGKDADGQSERKISQITFKHQLDAETSQDQARLVHKLIARYVEGEAAWVEKYPTSRYAPKLLHDVGLVVGRCRLLGEELRLLKMWGCMKLDILSVSCTDTRVHIVFSSLEKFSKFEVTLSVSLTNLLCVLQLEDFKNIIGNATSQQVEEIVASFSPGRNVLTKMIKKIHEKLLC